jgi:excisionase family DNA binding protein
MCSGNDNENNPASAVSTSEKRSYTVLEVASLLQISKSKAYELCREGLFKTIKVGRSVRVSMLSFDEWLDDQ